MYQEDLSQSVNLETIEQDFRQSVNILVVEDHEAEIKSKQDNKLYSTSERINLTEPLRQALQANTPDLIQNIIKQARKDQKLTDLLTNMNFFGGKPILHYAILINSSNEIIRVLLVNGANPNQLDISNNSALSRAANNIEAMKLLITSGKVENLNPLVNEIPLFNFCVINHFTNQPLIRVVELLLNYGVDPRTSIYMGKNALSHAFHDDMKKLLENKIKELDQAEQENLLDSDLILRKLIKAMEEEDDVLEQEAIEEAKDAGRENVVVTQAKDYLDRKNILDIEARKAFINRFITAIKENNLEEVKNCIKKVNSDEVLNDLYNQEIFGTKVLHYVADKDRSYDNLFQLLVDNGTNSLLSQKDGSDTSLMSIVLRRRDDAKIETLIRSKKVDLNEVTKYGTTPLIECTINSKANLVELLFEHGVDPLNDFKHSGKTALGKAISSHKEVAKKFTQAISSKKEREHSSVDNISEMEQSIVTNIDNYIKLDSDRSLKSVIGQAIKYRILRPLLSTQFYDLTINEYAFHMGCSEEIMNLLLEGQEKAKETQEKTELSPQEEKDFLDSLYLAIKNNDIIWVKNIVHDAEKIGFLEALMSRDVFLSLNALKYAQGTNRDQQIIAFLSDVNDKIKSENIEFTEEKVDTHVTSSEPDKKALLQRFKASIDNSNVGELLEILNEAQNYDLLSYLLNEPLFSNYRALHYSIYSKAKDEVFQELINNGADPKHIDSFGRSVTAYAEDCRAWAKVKILIESGKIDLNKILDNNSGLTLAVELIKRNQVELLQILLEKGLDLREIKFDNQDALAIAGNLKSLHKEMFTVVNNAIEDQNRKQAISMSEELIIAIKELNIEKVERNINLLRESNLLKYITNAQDADGTTLLIEIIKSSADTNKREIIRILLDNGFNAFLANKYGQTPLMLAISQDEDIVNMLLQYSDVNAVDNYGYTATMLAILLNKEDLVINFLKAGANDSINYAAIIFSEQLINSGYVNILLANRESFTLNHENRIKFIAHLSDKEIIQISDKDNLQHKDCSSIANDMDLLLQENQIIQIIQSEREDKYSKMLKDEIDSSEHLNLGKMKKLLESLNKEISIEKILNKNYYEGKPFLVYFLSKFKHSQEYIACQFVELFIDNGSNIDYQNDNGDTPLMLAVSANQAKIVDKLLKKGAEIDLINNSGYTAAMIALQEDNEKILKTLLDKKAKIALSDSICLVTIIKLAKDGCKKMILKNGNEIILEEKTFIKAAIAFRNGEITNFKDENGDEFIHELIFDDNAMENYAAQHKLIIEISKYNFALQPKKSVDKKANTKEDLETRKIEMTPYEAIIYGITVQDSQKVINVIESLQEGELRSLINKRSKDGSTILTVPACIRRLSVLDAIARSEGTHEVLRIKSEQKKILEILLQYVENIDSQDDKGLSALMDAVIYGRDDIVTLLLQHGANPDLQDYKQGGTALIHAFLGEYYNIFNILLENGANPNIKIREVCTALTLAVMFEKQDIVEKLLSHGAEPDPTLDYSVLLAVAQLNVNKVSLRDGKVIDAQDFFELLKIVQALQNDNVIEIFDGKNKRITLNEVAELIFEHKSHEIILAISNSIKSNEMEELENPDEENIQQSFAIIEEENPNEKNIQESFAIIEEENPNEKNIQESLKQGESFFAIKEYVESNNIITPNYIDNGMNLPTNQELITNTPLFESYQSSSSSSTSSSSSMGFSYYNNCLYGSVIFFKASDFIVDSYRLFSNSFNVENAKKVARDIVHLQGMFISNKYSIGITLMDTGINIYEGNFKEIAKTSVYVTLPIMLENIRFLGTPFGVNIPDYIGKYSKAAYMTIVAGFSGCNAAINAYSLYQYTKEKDDEISGNDSNIFDL